MFSIQDELRRLAPIALSPEPTQAEAPASALAQWDALTRSISRLGKEQWRANRNAELAIEQTAAMGSSLKELCDDLRRQLQAERQGAVEARLAAVSMVDHLDDLMVMARQRGEAQWTTRVERLLARSLDALAAMGLSEIPAADTPFDEHVHEAVDAVDRGDRDAFVIVEVVRRGFRFEGRVLRRTQVVATR